MAKIILDAGHGGTDPGAVYNGRKEKDDNLALALAVGDILEKNGVEVEYIRTEDVYEKPFEKAQKANQAEGDFLISFHRNSSPQANQYSGVETLIYDKSGNKEKLAENINEELEQVGFRNLGISERPGLVILRRTEMPAVLVETGFINTDADNARFESQFQEIAQAIAEAVLRTLDTVESQEQKNENCYRVQTGAFRRKEYAEDQLYQLLEKHFPAYIFYEDGYYKVQTGAFCKMENAVMMEKALRKQGYSTFITKL